jgi:putative chitinase
MASLFEHPESALEPGVAAKLVAAFIKRAERQLRNAIQANDLTAARRAVNGGIHGLERFVEAYEVGLKLVTPQDFPRGLCA